MPVTGEVDFDTFSRSYDALRGTSRERLMPWVAETTKYIHLGRNERLLDIGCGTGRYTELFADYCGGITGMDKSAGMLEVAARHKSAVSYLRGDAERLPFVDGCFNAATMFMAVHHLTSQKRAGMLQEVRRILCEGGRILILTESHARMRRSIWKFFPGFLEIEYSRFPDLRKLSSEMERAGFTTGHKSVRIVFGAISTEEYLLKVKKKFISTFSLMSEEQFSAGFRVFSERVRAYHPDVLPDYQEFTLVRGTKS